MVRPCDADTALRELKDKGIRVGSVAGFPWGFTTTSAKLYEARDLLRRGVQQINVYVNIGKMVSRQFEYCETELYQMNESCKESGAILKVIVDAKLGEEMKILACRMTKRIRAPFAAITENRDIDLMKKHTGLVAELEVGGVKTLDEILALHQQGVAHYQTTAVEQILDEWQKRLEAQAKQITNSPTPAG